MLSTGTMIKALLVLALAWLAYELRDLVLVILVSVVIASAVDPMVRWLGRYRLPRVPATILVYVVAFGLFAVLLPFFLLPVLSDLLALSSTLPELLGNIPAFLNDRLPLESLGGRGLPLGQLFTSLENGLVNLPKGFVQVASLIFGGFFSFILITVISFYLTVQPQGIETFLRLVTPVAQEDYVLGLWQRAKRKIGYWMQGQILLGLLIGVLVFLGLTIFQVPYALVLAILAALFEFIPYFGPILAAVPAVMLGFSQSVGLGLLVLGFYIIVQQFENHLIYPLVVTKMVGVPPLIVILALLVGGQLAGFLGLILAVPVATVFMELAADYEKRKYLFRNG